MLTSLVGCRAGVCRASPVSLTPQHRASTVARRTAASDDPAMTDTTVLIVDDHAGFRAAARELLSRIGFDVVGEAADAKAALAEILRLRPAVVLLDVRLPDLDGFEVTRRLRTRGDEVAVVLVSTREAADYGRQVRDSGAAGFITKSSLSGDTLLAILRRHKEEPT